MLTGLVVTAGCFSAAAVATPDTGHELAGTQPEPQQVPIEPTQTEETTKLDAEQAKQAGPDRPASTKRARKHAKSNQRLPSAQSAKGRRLL